jgi:MamI restriction endonuclease
MRVPNPKAMTTALTSASPEEILEDLFVAPRAAVRKWAEVTDQTAQAKTSYLAQHLASVLTGVPGEGTAARGNDLVDGSEVKSCSRADQLGKCKKCAAPVGAWRAECGKCGSTEVQRKTDSHWLFSIRSEAELQQLMADPRIVFILSDRTHGNNDIRARAWEVWPGDPSHAHLGEFARDYYENNYLVKSKAAPANLHPLTFDFLMMNPVRTFDARLIDVDQPSASIKIDERFDPRRDRDQAPVEDMPPSLCTPDEIKALLNSGSELLKPALAKGKDLSDVQAAAKKRGAKFRAAVDAAFPSIPPAARLLIPMRSKRIKTSKSSYKRRAVGV